MEKERNTDDEIDQYTAELNQMFDAIDQYKVENNIVPSNHQEEEVNLDKNPEEDVQEEIEEELEENSEENSEKDLEKQKKINNRVWDQKKRTYQVMAEKKAVIAELEKREAENLYLKQLLNDSLNAINNSAIESAQFELDIAKKNYKKAIDESDPDALTEASVAIAAATAKINDIKRSSYDFSPRNQAVDYPAENYREKRNIPPASKPPAQAEHTEEEIEIISDWIQDHPYLDPSSSKYNVGLYNQVSKFIDNKNQELQRKGQQHQYLSEEYFNTLNNYIENIKPQFYKNSQPRQNIGSTPNVGGVRNSNVSSIQGKSHDRPKITLTALEKELCANSGGILTEKALIAEKLAELKSQNRR